MSRLKIQSGEKATASKNNEMRLAHNGKLIITFYNEKKCAFLISEGRLIAGTVLDESKIRPEDIVIAIVKDVKKDIGACFIEYEEGKDGYLPFDKIPGDLLPKQGDLIPVSLTAHAQKGKRAKFTAKINYSKIENGEELREHSKHLSKFNYLYRSDNITLNINKVFRKDEYDEIVTDDEEIYHFLQEKNFDIRLYNDNALSLSKLYSLETQVSEALSRQVWLKCGGYLIFDHTEAMTVIDVNSGKYTPSRNTDKESAYLKVNIEAATAICRQLRTRNLSGIIIVDFINLDNKEDQDILLEILRAESKNDTEAVTVIDITQLGLAEITRKKSLPSLYEQLIKSSNDN